ncbi:response regulator [Candidatus Woesearchaeota archaeon]|nr:response regulator [Candidatus Woesearchaeota archaeon]
MIKVLLVDDSRTALEIISFFLEKDPAIQVIGTAINGKDAITFLKSAPVNPDVIVLDIKMPVMDGVETMEYIMSYHPTPILIVTALERDEILSKAHSLGIFDIIQKPMSKGVEDISSIGQEIIERVKQLAQGNVIFDNE